MKTMNGFVDKLLPAREGCARLIFVDSITGMKWSCTGTPHFRGGIPPLCQLARICGWPAQLNDAFTDFIFTEIAAVNN